MTDDARFELAYFVASLLAEGFEASEAFETAVERGTPKKLARQVVDAVELARPLFLSEEGEEGDDDEDEVPDPEDLHAEVVSVLTKKKVPLDLAETVFDAWVAAFHASSEGEHEVSVRDSSGVPVLVLAGAFNELEDESLERLQAALADVRRRGPSLLVDCSQLEFAQINILGEVLADLTERQQAGGDIVFFGLSDELQEMFHDFEMLDHLTVAEDEAEAREGQPRGGEPVERRFSVQPEQRGDSTLLVLRGALTSDRAAELGEKVEAAVPPSARAVLDVSGVPYLGSAAFAVLVNLAMRSKDGGGELVLAGLWGAPKVMVDALGLAALFTLADSVEDALGSS